MLSRLRRRGDDGGFTLIELVITISIVGIIVVALAGVVLQYFKVSTTTQTRLDESTDQQFVSAYWQQDVSSLGVHGFTPDDVDQLPAQPSVWTSTAPSGTPSGCTSGLPGTVVIGFAWNDYPSSTGPSDDPTTVWTNAVVNAAVYTAQQVGDEWQLSRVRCTGAAATTIVVAHHLTAAPTPACLADDAQTVVPCSATDPVPATVTLRLDVAAHETGEAASTTGYNVTLSAQRRQG
jgi:prepilin-type N-terminal cleavage/methylation domain-containing protein